MKIEDLLGENVVKDALSQEIKWMQKLQKGVYKEQESFYKLIFQL